MKLSSSKQYDSFFDLTNLLSALAIVDTSDIQESFSDAFADDWEKCDDCGYEGLNYCDCWDEDEDDEDWDDEYE